MCLAAPHPHPLFLLSPPSSYQAISLPYPTENASLMDPYHHRALQPRRMASFQDWILSSASTGNQLLVCSIPTSLTRLLTLPSHPPHHPLDRCTLPRSKFCSRSILHRFAALLTRTTRSTERLAHCTPHGRVAVDNQVYSAALDNQVYSPGYLSFLSTFVRKNARQA